MNFLEEIIAIIIGVAIVDITFRVAECIIKRKQDKKKKKEEEKRNRRMAKLDIGCEYCEDVKRLYRTPDKQFWLCKTCMEGYFEQNECTDEQKEKVRKQYRVNRKKKRKV